MIEVRRRFAATPEQVFDAWTLPEVLTEWWAAGPSHRPGLAEVDLRVGGRYRLSMIDGDGVETIIAGEYVEAVHHGAALARTGKPRRTASAGKVSITTSRSVSRKTTNQKPEAMWHHHSYLAPGEPERLNT